VELDNSFWKRRWETAHQQARPNRTLADTVARLPAGTALDAGCGAGADAVWLAERGWTVTAVDFVAAALDRGRVHAQRLGDEVAQRIDWQPADLSTWPPPPDTFDLVSAHYLHGIANRDSLFRRLAAAVRPGGTLLIVGHHPSNIDISGGAMAGEVFFSTAEVLAVLDEDWEPVTVDDAVPRESADREGRPVLLRSAVVAARRQPSTPRRMSTRAAG
jgi:SAM-dependent methyltransferase